MHHDLLILKCEKSIGYNHRPDDVLNFKHVSKKDRGDRNFRKLRFHGDPYHTLCHKFLHDISHGP